MRGLGLLVLGLGLGLGAGYLATEQGGSPALVWLAAGLIVLSSVLLAVGSRGATELVRVEPSVKPERPTLAGLGERVEKILELAEEQAADKIRSAEEEAERIVAEAKARQLPG